MIHLTCSSNNRKGENRFRLLLFPSFSEKTIYDYDLRRVLKRKRKHILSSLECALPIILCNHWSLVRNLANNTSNGIKHEFTAFMRPNSLAGQMRKKKKQKIKIWKRRCCARGKNREKLQGFSRHFHHFLFRVSLFPSSCSTAVTRTSSCCCNNPPPETLINPRQDKD